jgi:5-methyltetrahydropteroyltriglutamate--homocysteine methyltransferase
MDRWPIKDSPYYGVGYERLLPEVLDIKVEQLVLEYASLGSGDPTKFVEHLPSSMEVGVGVIDVRNRDVEQPSEIAQKVERLLKHCSPDKVWLNPDCGFAPGMYRGFPRDVAASKLKAMVAAAQMLRTRHAGP